MFNLLIKSKDFKQAFPPNKMQEAIKAFKEGKEGANLKMIAQEYNLNEIELENAIKKLEEETVINNK